MLNVLSPDEIKRRLAIWWRNERRHNRSAHEAGIDQATLRNTLMRAEQEGMLRRDENGALVPTFDVPPRQPALEDPPSSPIGDGELISPSADATADHTPEQLETYRLRETVKTLRAQLQAAEKQSLSDAVVREAIMGLAQQQPSPPDWVVEARADTGTSGIPCTLWSDWHWAEVVRPEEVAGVNEFNIEIAHERVHRLVDRIIDLCFRHMVNPVYPGIVVCLGGDIINGQIHDELIDTAAMPVAPSLIDVQGVLIWALTQMADHFGRVFVPCVVGNHGRMTMKPRSKGRVHSSFEWLLYCQLERHFRDDPRIRFSIPGEADAHFMIAGHRYMLTHGDSLGVKGGDGIIGVLGPIARGAIKTRVSEAQIGRDFDTVLMGHWHQLLWLPGAIVNGALKGYDEYARLFLRARYQPPSQALWFTHPKHGITYQVPIYLGEARTADQQWLTWAETGEAA